MYLKSLNLPKARILVIEEDPHLRRVLCRLLIDAGYAMPDATHDETSLDHVDLVLASVSARRSLWAPLDLCDPAVPVIVLVDHAAWTGFDFFDAANALGAIAVLQRPFSRGVLLQLMSTVLSKTAGEPVATAPGAVDEITPANLLMV